MSDHAMNEYLKTLQSRLDASESRVDDFVVEQGISGDWTYRKWNSGIAECWRTWTSAAFAPATAVGGFYGRVLPNSGTYSLPSGLFVTAPIMSVNLTEWGSGYFWGSARAVTNTSFKMTLFRNDNASSAGVAKIYAIGSWR